MLVNVQGPIVHPFGIFLATLKNSGKIPTFCRNVGILPEHKKYAGSDLLALTRRSELAYFCVLVKYQHFVEMLVNVDILPEHKNMPALTFWL